ncbi:MAG: hypothetical protein ACTHKG_00335 [Nocardioides sp.]
MELDWIADIDGQAAADAVVANRARLVEAEVVEFVLAAHWADLHDEATVEGGEGSGRVLAGSERALRLGGDGTPRVAEFAAAELGCLLGRGAVAARTLIADALDVRHRHPLLWAAVGAGEILVWQARKVAARTRSLCLSWEQALWVDAQVAPYARSLPWTSFLDLVEAKIVEVDPGAAQARADAAAMERFVATGQCNEYGLKTVIAKAAAGDAVFFVGMCDRIAACLAQEGDTDPIGARRSKALGILADPVRALELLLAHATDPEPTNSEDAADTPDTRDIDDSPHAAGADGADDTAAADGADDTADADDPGDPDGTEDPEVVSAGDVPAAEDDSDDAAEAAEAGGSGCPTCGTPAGGGTRLSRLAGVLADPAAFVAALAEVDPRRVGPVATLYVHMSRESFDAARAGEATGVARVEGVGPVTVGQAQEFLGHARVRMAPVIDLAEDSPVDGYEVPDRMGEALHLRTPAGVFPYSSNLSRRKDRDHTRPYVPPDRGGPPGQTRISNLGPMGRYAHRVKTHGRGWRHYQPVPGGVLVAHPARLLAAHRLHRNPPARQVPEPLGACRPGRPRRTARRHRLTGRAALRRPHHPRLLKRASPLAAPGAPSQ